MNDRTKWLIFGPVAGFFVVVAFGVGLISMAAFDSSRLAGATTQPSEGFQMLDVQLGDLFIRPAMLHAEPGPVTLRIHNGGGTEHNFAIPGVGSTPMIPPGETVTMDIPLDPGDYPFLCEVPGHADGGMMGSLMVLPRGTDMESPAPGEGSAGSSMEGMTPEEMAAHDAERTASFPAETDGRGGQVLEPTIAPDGAKVFELTASVIQWETEPGKVQEAWAYNGMVPGPTLKAQLGDRVRIVLQNELPEPTTIHLHGMTVPNAMDGVAAISQDAVLPGERFVYEFTVRNTGSNMYHSHFNAVKQVPMGLLGALIVPDPADPKVDVDYTMIVNDGPLGFTLNDKGFPATEPLVAGRGQLVRIRYMNEGLQIHPMHLHGLAQTVIAKDGHLLEHPYTADTVLVAPGERYDVLVRATEPGVWAWHCHVLSHAEGPDGMYGMVTAMIVE